MALIVQLFPGHVSGVFYFSLSTFYLMVVTPLTSDRASICHGPFAQLPTSIFYLQMDLLASGSQLPTSSFDLLFSETSALALHKKVSENQQIHLRA
jgi:hypothetical protein